MIKEGNTKHQRKFSLGEWLQSHWEIANVKTKIRFFGIYCQLKQLQSGLAQTQLLLNFFLFNLSK